MIFFRKNACLPACTLCVYFDLATKASGKVKDSYTHLDIPSKKKVYSRREMYRHTRNTTRGIFKDAMNRCNDCLAGSTYDIDLLCFLLSVDFLVMLIYTQEQHKECFNLSYVSHTTRNMR